jgi:hypothetical protein
MHASIAIFFFSLSASKLFSLHVVNKDDGNKEKKNPGKCTVLQIFFALFY